MGMKLAAGPVMRQFMEELQMNMKTRWTECQKYIVLQAGIPGTKVNLYMRQVFKVPDKPALSHLKDYYIERTTGMTPANTATKEFEAQIILYCL